MGNPVVQFQILSKTPDKTAEFYSTLFGWTISANNAMGYRQIDTGSKEGIQGGIWPAPPQAPEFVQLFMAGQPWDTHSKNAESLKGLTARTDQPSAALVQDLKQRGLLDETIVLWTGEFGRLPVSQGADGRDHTRRAFSLWLAGGGFKAGYVHGATDDFSYESVEKVVNVHDLHATLLHTLGLEHESLTYPHEGREASLTDAEVTHAKIVGELLA